jgi:hypothetical protein
MPERSPDNDSQTNAQIHTDHLFVHDTALIANSAQLQTTTPHRIEIGAGVVIGEGCWLQACSGDIVIESGTVLGVGVLIVGWGNIGALSIIGSAVTLFETAIESGSTIAAHSVQGLPERDLPLPLTASVPDIANEVDNLADPWDDGSDADAEAEDNQSSVSSNSGAIEEETRPVDPISVTPTPPTPQSDSSFKVPLTSGAFIRSWKRPPTAPVVDTKSPVEAQNIHSTNPSPVDPTPAQADGITTAPGSPSEKVSPTSTETVLPSSEKSDNHHFHEPQNDDPAIEAIIEETIVTQSISKSKSVYGRQHVNRIIDSILRRNTPET